MSPRFSAPGKANVHHQTRDPKKHWVDARSRDPLLVLAKVEGEPSFGHAGRMNMVEGLTRSRYASAGAPSRTSEPRGIPDDVEYLKSRLLATSAIAGLSILQLSAPAQARSLGIRSEQPDTLEISVGEDEEIVGDDIGIYADNGAGRPEQGQNAPAPIDNRRYSKLVATPSGEWVHGSDCRESERARPRASPFFVERSWVSCCLARKRMSPASRFAGQILPAIRSP